MQRSAVFVDAGYLLVAGGVIYCQGIKDRRHIRCDYAGVAEALRQFVETHSSMPMLRIYWYDGAPNAVAQRDHLAIAALPHVKLRLGRLVSGEQKGVDSLVVRDLMVLARERAIATAYLFGGDEDLREGVAAAQDMGVRVVLIGLRPIPQAQPADTLIHEADDVVVIPDALLQPHFTRVRPAVIAAAATQPVTTAPTGTPPTPPVPAPPPPATATPAVPIPAAPPSAAPTRSERNVTEIARECARIWAAQITAPEVERVAASAPYLPLDVDRQLIFFAQRELGSLHDREDVRRQLRTEFHAGLQEIMKNQGQSSTL